MNTLQNRGSHTTLLVICGALCMGPMFFAAITLFLALQKGLTITVKELTVVAIIGAAIITPLSFILVPLITRNTIAQIKKKLDTHEKANMDILRLHANSILQSSTIIRFAMLEGAVFLLLLVAFIESNLLPWILAVVLVVLMVMQIPFRTRYEDAIDFISKRLRA